MNLTSQLPSLACSLVFNFQNAPLLTVADPCFPPLPTDVIHPSSHNHHIHWNHSISNPKKTPICKKPSIFTVIPFASELPQSAAFITDQRVMIVFHIDNTTSQVNFLRQVCQGSLSPSDGGVCPLPCHCDCIVNPVVCKISPSNYSLPLSLHPFSHFAPLLTFYFFLITKATTHPPIKITVQMANPHQNHLSKYCLMVSIFDCGLGVEWSEMGE